MGELGHAAWMGEIRSRYSFSVGNHKWKKPFESCGRRWKNDIEVDLHKRGVRIVAGFQWFSIHSSGLLLCMW